MVVRPIAPRDVYPLADLVFDAVHRGTRHVYSAGQRAAWMPRAPSGGEWHRRLLRDVGWIIEHLGKRAGVLTLSDQGHIDLAYVTPDLMGTGLGGRLLDYAVATARRRGLRRMTVDASMVAAPFFARHGWRTIRRQRVRRKGVLLENVRMNLDLRQPAYWIYRSCGSNWRSLSASRTESYVSWSMA